MSTGLCQFCGCTYSLLYGHACHPTIIMSTGTTSMVAQHTYTPHCDGFHPPGECKPVPREAGLFAEIPPWDPARLSDDDVDRIAARVEQRLAERARLRGVP